MASDLGSTKPRTDGNGVQVVATPGARTARWILVSLLALLGIGAFLLVRMMRAEDSGLRAAVGDARAALPAATPAPRVTQSASSPAPSEPPRMRGRGAARKTEELPFTLLKPGERAGLAIFPPPGTKPIKHGIIVPENFELPEGYVRHYQTTDDGRRLPPILMFHPDYEGVDADGNPVPLPEDRVVPPDMVPRGMAVERLDDPEHAGASARAAEHVGEPGTTGRGR